MFKSKPIWWTCLAAWTIFSVYWHTCRIKGLCGIFEYQQYPYSGKSFGIFTHRTFRLLTYQISLDLLIQYAIILSIAMLLGFFIGNSYENKKTRDLKYKLSRMDRELQYFQLKQ
jgi:hypothetical protein